MGGGGGGNVDVELRLFGGFVDVMCRFGGVLC